jgi:hypothetical protein
MQQSYWIRPKTPLVKQITKQTKRTRDVGLSVYSAYIGILYGVTVYRHDWYAGEQQKKL